MSNPIIAIFPPRSKVQSAKLLAPDESNRFISETKICDTNSKNTLFPNKK